MNTSDTHPFGYWITAVDRLMRTEFATLFDDEGITRRDWRMLNRIDGTAPSERPVHSAKLRRLVELGWVQRTRDGWALTDAGTLAKQRLGTAVDELRARVAGAVSPEDYATMTASLEKIAREFGWAEGKRLPRYEGRGHGHRGGHCHGFGRHGHRPHGQGFGRGRGRDAHGHEHGEHGERDFDQERERGFHGHDRDERCRGARESFSPRAHGHRGFGPHTHHGHGFHRHMAPATHIHVHTHG